jgi:type IX secretion system PorP/SprF family membrane protein
LASWNAQAQDIHFSQFGVSNLTLNPATVGVMTCNARVSLIYRNQWASALGDKAFNTFGVGGEMKFNAGKSDFWGAGVNVWTDIAGTSKFASTQAALSASYLKKIGGRRANDHFLVAGVQVGFIQQSIRTNELTWGSQWSGSQFDRSLDSDNALNGAPTNNVNFDLSAGLMWFSSFGKDGKSNLYVGIGFQHLTKANISFLNTEEALYTKYTIHGGADIRIKKRLAIVPVFATWVQGPSVQLNVGAGVKFDFSKQHKVLKHLP